MCGVGGKILLSFPFYLNWTILNLVFRSFVLMLIGNNNNTNDMITKKNAIHRIKKYREFAGYNQLDLK